MSIHRPLLLCMALFVSGCSRNERAGDISASLEQAVTSPRDSQAQVDALKQLEHHGTRRDSEGHMARRPKFCREQIRHG